MRRPIPQSLRIGARLSVEAGGGGDDAGMMGAGFLHVSDVLVEIARQFGGPRQVHEEGPLVVSGRSSFCQQVRHQRPTCSGSVNRRISFMRVM